VLGLQRDISACWSSTRLKEAKIDFRRDVRIAPVRSENS
jgi:hypothetical protein